MSLFDVKQVCFGAKITVKFNIFSNVYYYFNLRCCLIHKY